MNQHSIAYMDKHLHQGPGMAGLPRILPSQPLILMLLLLLALWGASHADASGWAKNYGTAAANAYVQATAVDASGNAYITGHFDGATLTLGSVTLNKVGNQDAFAAKLDANGTVLWAQNYGGSGAYVTAKGIAVDGSGQAYLTGYFMSNNLTTPALTRIGHANADAFVFKLDTSGTPVWAKNYGGYTAFNGSAFAAGQSIAVDGTGNVYMCGYFTIANLDVPALAKIGESDAFVLKLDASGNTTWANSYGGSGATAQCKSIAVDGVGNVHLGGSFSSADLTTPVLAQIGSSDAFVFKLDASGTPVWQNNYGGSGASMLSNAIAVDGSGNVYLGGNFEAADLTTPALAKIGSQDAFALKLNSSGNTVWARNYGGSGSSVFGYSIAVDGSGNVYLGGDIDDNLTTPALTKIGAQDAFALKLDASGNTTWARNYGGSGAYATGSAIAVDGSGNIFLGGYFDASLTTPMLTLNGATDALLLKTTASTITYSGSTATGTGTATATLSAGGAFCGFTAPQFVLPMASPPAGVSFPHGLFDFTLDGCTAGDTATVTVTYPGAIPVGTQYWKYGSTPDNAAQHWYTIPATISGNTVTFSITDGGTGDDDWALSPNGIIVDQGGPGLAGASAIPTLSEWGLILLAGMLGLFGVGVMRQHPRVGR